jgi:NAD(P)H-hydrate epimerase
MREIDRRAIEEYHIPGIVLMENAARGVVEVAMEMLNQWTHFVPKVAVLCGGGNNGGDGLAVARHLANRGVDVWIGLLTDPSKFRGEAGVNWQIVQAMRLACATPNDENLSFFVHNSNLVIDGIFGTGLESPPREPDRIEMINELADTVLSIDLPSGMNCDTGEAMGACIRAARTVTFVAEKAGFANPRSKEFTGEVLVGDIGCPRELIEDVARSVR